ncbi:MAG TPA: aldose epimerase family protein [Chitinophagaceae bacterium]|nr:aldose epimerase family protein [Chitinophagaceae bacterium]
MITLPDKKKFVQTIDNKPVELFFLKNSNVQIAITNYGGRIAGLWLPDSKGKITDVVAGFKSLDDYIHSKEPYYGALIGRYGNRIKQAKFSLDNIAYTLSVNNGPNQLHGGKKGFQYVVWDAQQISDSVLRLHYLSKDGEEGFPGNLDVTVVYTLTTEKELKIEYSATTDKKTVVNLTAHPFFNLNGEGSGTINNHLLTIMADKYTPVDSEVVANGTIEPVTGTPFDFRQATAIGLRVNDNNEQLKFGKGYDHNFVLTKGITAEPELAAIVQGDKSGIIMHVLTTEPGLQFYGGNFMKGENTFKSGIKDEYRTTFCLEAQHYPDSPNNPQFPSTTLNTGETYHQKTIYKFFTK